MYSYSYSCTVSAWFNITKPLPVLTLVIANAGFAVSRLGVKDCGLVASITAKELLLLNDAGTLVSSLIVKASWS